jgi:diaminohydroxyphosphoribosylaminopyrimidine deaminase/5-amino-6-(5-phosphoribosylamino)uracil reductase
VDAIMVGAGTVRADNPSLTARVGRKTSYPKRVIMTCKGGLPDDLAMLKLPGETFVATARSTQNASLMKLEQAGARILEMEDRDGWFSVEDVLRRLAEMGVLSVLIEGGAGIAGRALDERVVDKALFFYAPKIIGGDAAVSGIGGEGVELVSNCPRVTDVKFRRFGEDFAVEGRVEYPPL